MTKSIAQTLWQTWCHDHFPGEAVPVTDHPLTEEPLPNVQPQVPLMQLHSVSLHLVTVCQREMSSSHSLISVKDAKDCNVVTHHPSLL